MLKFSQVEIKHLLRAWILVSLMFAIAMTGLSSQLLIVLPFTLFTAGIAFLLHELAHKAVAQSYRCWAEFRANDQMLVLGLILSFTGMIIAAPGGVYIHRASRDQHGKIALAGPMTNVLLAALFLALSKITSSAILLSLFAYGIHINSLLAAFNLIPFPPFDGKSVWDWNKAAYIFAAILAGGLIVVTTV